MNVFLSSKEEWALCLVTMVWGVTFLLIRLAMTSCGPFFFVGLRFAVASCAVACLSFSLLRGLTGLEVLAGLLLGVIVFLGFGLQTLGLTAIPAGKSAFITAFYVPLVPLFEILLMHHMPKAAVWKGLALSFPGVLLVSWSDSLDGGIGFGEWVTIVCAIIFALEIVVIGIFAPKVNARRLVFIELVVTSLCSFAVMPLAGEHFASLPTWIWVSVFGLGLATACIQSVITWAQKKIPPTRATLIYAGEPLWAGFFGWLAGESLGPIALVGCVLIMAGILVSARK